MMRLFVVVMAFALFVLLACTSSRNDALNGQQVAEARMVVQTSEQNCSTDQPIVTEYEIVIQIWIQNCTRRGDSFFVGEKQVEFWNGSHEFINLYKNGESEPFIMLDPGDKHQLAVMSGDVRWEKY